MGVEPSLVPEKRTNGLRDLPVLIPFKSGRERAAVKQHGPSQPDKLCLGVERMVGRLMRFTSNRRHGQPPRRGARRMHRARILASDSVARRCGTSQFCDPARLERVRRLRFGESCPALNDRHSPPNFDGLPRPSPAPGPFLLSLGFRLTAAPPFDVLAYSTSFSSGFSRKTASIREL